MKQLTPKQALFVEQYLIDLNATQSAIRAGYSKKTAESIGNENLRKPQVAKAIKEAMDKRSERTEITQDWVLKRMAARADADIKRLMKWDEGGVLFHDSDDLEWQDSYTVDEVVLKETIRETEDGKELILNREKRLKIGGKDKNLEMIGRHLGMFNDKLQLQGDENKPLHTVQELKHLTDDQLLEQINALTKGE